MNYCDDLIATIRIMKQNTEIWKTASKDQRTVLEEENHNLAVSIEAKYKSGTWTARNGSLGIIDVTDLFKSENI